jgi:gliding motility-associated-like protein
MQGEREATPGLLKAGVVLIVAMLLSLGVRATHIIGGDVSMRTVGTTPGLFLLQLNQYWDETKTNAGNRDQTVQLLVYRKNNPVLVERIDITLQETLPLTFDNAACASLRQLSFTQAKYYRTYQFDVQKYTDPGGYYIVWERCCRNDNLTNVNSATADGVGMVFYLEFPAMTKNGVNFKNSAPDFRLPNGDYICLNKPFTFNASATDADGDQLKYSLVTPMNGYTNRGVPSSIDQRPRSYPLVTWASGYGLSNIIPGNPPLTINANTGQLTVRASQEGLFLFTVQCEEFRNGERIGVVRRDFQLPVVDCSKNTPPPAVVMANNKVASDISWCGSKPLVLSVEKNPIWAYQWQKDGINIRGSTFDTLTVRESGVYTVVKSQANVCANDTTSQAVKVTLSNTASIKLSVTTPAPYCQGDTVTLQADGQPGALYQWRRNGAAIAGDQATLRVYQSGTYRVFSKSVVAAECDGLDSLLVTINPSPTVQISAGNSTLCPDSSVLITASNAGGYRYQWQQNATRLTDTTSRLTARQAGTYRVTATAPTGCTALSNQLTLTQAARPFVGLDSIASVCITNPAVVLLRGQPAGGTYSGAGVQGNSFNPAIAGIGRHKVAYTITSADGCRVSQNRWAVVSGGPNLTGQTRYGIVKGRTVQLVTQTDEPISTYRWEPPASLDRADVASPEATPTVTTPYQLTAVSVSGCIATLSVLVEVTEPLYIPSAFSPNADGLNDAWVIPNIVSFPQAEVSIYSRWGELIFFSKGYDKPWDGTYHQQPVQSGIYTYQINTGAGSLTATYRGQLTVIH